LKSDFYRRVYAVVACIPEGKATSYGAIARFLGSAKSARLVGTALKHSIGHAPIPAHRVVNSQGLLTGKHAFETPDTMACLLKAEGLELENDQILDWSQYFWDPAEHLNPLDF
jgi:methylated-DNA-protein-cysteine methyltransferase-like protein